MGNGTWRENLGSRPISAMLTAEPGSALAAIYADLFWGSAPAAYNEGLAESVTLAEALAAGAGYGAGLAETVTLSESLAASAAYPVALGETVAGLAEALSASLAASAALAETASLSEALGAVQAASVALGESTSLAEALSASAAMAAALGEALSLAEAIEASQSGGTQHYLVEVGESVALAEALGVSLGTSVALAEVISLLEALTSLVLTARGARALTAEQSTRTTTAEQSLRELVLVMPADVAIPTFFRTEQGQVDYRLTEDGAAVNLAGLTVTVVVHNKRTGQRDSRPATVLDAAAGKVRAIWPPRTLGAGTYDLQFLVAAPGGGTPAVWPRTGYASLIVQEPL
jgi:hypothetical protein